MKKVLMSILLIMFMSFASGCFDIETNDETTDEQEQLDYQIVGELSINVEAILENYSVEVTGQIKNISGSQASYGQVTFNIYDSNNILLGTAMDNINYWNNQTIWSFNASGYITSGIPHRAVLQDVTLF